MTVLVASAKVSIFQFIFQERNLACSSIVLKGNRSFFARMLLLAQSRDIDMREVLSHLLGPFPLSIATGLGIMQKTQKSKLMHVIESKGENHIAGTTPDGNNAFIIDGMAHIQKSLKLPSTFGEYAL